MFVKGQTVSIDGCGNIYGGPHVITGTIPGINIPVSISTAFWSFFTNYSWPNGYSFIQFAKVHANDPFHRIIPSGKASGQDTKELHYRSIRELVDML